MPATRKDITIYQTTDFEEAFVIASSFGSLAGAAAAMQIRKTFGDTEAVATLNTWGSTLVLDETARTLTPQIDEILSASLPAGQLVYDVKLMTTGGHTSITHQGFVNVRPVATTIPFPDSQESVYGDGEGNVYGDGEGNVYGPGAGN